MIKLMAVLALLLTTWMSNLNAGGGDVDCESNVYFFQDYIGQIAEIGANTAKYFNLGYLSQEMKKQGIPNEEITIRLLKYTSSIDQLLGGIELMGVNVSCASQSSRLVFKVDDKGSVGKGDYIIVRLVEGRLINVSFEELGVLLGSVKIQDLAYKKL